MPAKSPEEVCRLFQQFMAAGDLESLLSLYDLEAVILGRSREMQRGSQGLRQQLAPMAAAKINFTFRIDHPVGGHRVDAYVLDSVLAGTYGRARR